MLRGEIFPEPDTMQRYRRPVIVDLYYQDICKDPFPEPWEAEILLRLGDRIESIFAPLFLVNEENGTVRAALVGERKDGQIFVHFPPTNFGQTRFYATEDELMSIARLPVVSGRPAISGR